MSLPTFKVCLIGEGCVGKTTLVKQWIDKKFEKQYVATLGVEVHPLVFSTNRGSIKFNIWDCAGQERLGGLRDGYYIQAHGAIVMFDLTDKMFLTHIEKWCSDFRRINPNAPMCVVANKYDLFDFDDEKNEAYIEKVRKTLLDHYKFYFTSNLTNLNIEKPFLYLIRKLMNDETIEIIKN